MWVMGDIIANDLNMLHAWGCDEYGRPEAGGYLDRLVNGYGDSSDEVEEPAPAKKEPIFPFIVPEKKVKIKCETNYNITLTDEQFDKFLEVIKSLKD